MAHIGALPKIHRYITAHDDKGKAVFSKAFNEESMMKANDDGIAFALSFTTKGFPVDMNDDQDLDVYGNYLKDAPGLVVSGGTVLRHVDRTLEQRNSAFLIAADVADYEGISEIEHTALNEIAAALHVDKAALLAASPAFPRAI
jgi:hypothetical protein